MSAWHLDCLGLRELKGTKRVEEGEELITRLIDRFRVN